MFSTAVTLTAGALASGAAIVGTTLTSAPSQADEPTTRTVACGAVWERLPAELRADLTALQDLTPTERRAAVKEIRRDALQGEYGDRVQRVAERRSDRRADLTRAEKRRLRSAVVDRLQDRRADCA